LEQTPAGVQRGVVMGGLGNCVGSESSVAEADDTVVNKDCVAYYGQVVEKECQAQRACEVVRSYFVKERVRARQGDAATI